jgi:hypothetical protein
MKGPIFYETKGPVTLPQQPKVGKGGSTHNKM